MAAANICGVKDTEVHDVIMLACQTSERGGDLAVAYAERLADIFANERSVFALQGKRHAFDQ